MKIKFKEQAFQKQAVDSVCNVFIGQNKGYKENTQYIFKNEVGNFLPIYGKKNIDIQIKSQNLLENIQKIQKDNNIFKSKQLEGDGLNLTIEMETGTGKTFVYINTIYELNKRYGMSRFIIIVPSVAIREGVYKSFSMMEDYFKAKYSKVCNYFIFNSSKAKEIENFPTRNGINIMIINNHAFNKADTNNMYKRGERGGKLIEYIAGTNPIIIIDEPQSVEGKKTKLALKDFNSLFTIRYSATHKEIYNMVYQLDSVDAFNKKLVKRINIKGIDIKGTTATHSYLYLQGIDISKKTYPKARIEIEIKQKKGISRVIRRIKEGDDLFSDNFSKGLNQYKEYKVSEITSEYVRFINGIKLYPSEIHGNVEEKYKRRIQIRETIRSHIRKERDLFKKGIKVLSLFFIDEVKNYREYSDKGEQIDGKYAEYFKEEYNRILEEIDIQDKEYKEYLEAIDISKTHQGYFSIDKKGKLIDSKEKGRGKEKTCDDVKAYDLIMKKKELLLDLKNDTRFIFSHSALREGWDNPNVFQICILRNTDPKEVKTRQEVGRGLRLCVNQQGERIDEDFDIDFRQANTLTVIANESYEKFAGNLQKEFSNNIRERAKQLTIEFLISKKLNGKKITEQIAREIHTDFIKKEYIDDNYNLTNKYYQDEEKNSLNLRDSLKKHNKEIMDLVRELSNNTMRIENEDKEGIVKNEINNENYDKEEFKRLWGYISVKSSYFVDFSTDVLIEKSIQEISDRLNVSGVYVEIKEGEMKNKFTGLDLKENKVFDSSQTESKKIKENIDYKIKYDLISKVVEETNLTRRTIIQILTKIEESKFKMFGDNPEDFILKVSKIINDEKTDIIYEKIQYYKSDKRIPISIFKEDISNQGEYIDVKKYLYEYLFYDSKVEKSFGKKLDNDVDILVFSKLPKNKYKIDTPVGGFSPDWIIIFDKDKVKYAYFVIETKGSEDKLGLRGIEKIKIDCAKKHFKAISDDKVKFDVCKDFDSFKQKVDASE